MTKYVTKHENEFTWQQAATMELNNNDKLV